MGSPRRLALVLSGGGVRAAAQIGVLKVFEEYGLTPDLVIGNSGGAIVGSLYAAGFSPSQIEAIFASYSGNPGRIVDLNYAGFLRAIFTLKLSALKGLVKGERLLNEMTLRLGATQSFADLQRKGDRRLPLLLVGVNLSNGEETVFASPSSEWSDRAAEAGVRVCSRLSIAEAVRVSTAIPGVFVPYVCPRADCPRNATCTSAYVDGGLRDGYPIATAARLAQAKYILGVNLGYSGLRRQSVLDGGLVDILGQSVDIFGQDQVEADRAYIQLTDSRLITINPLIYSVGTFEVKKIPWLISRGEAVAREFMANFPGLRPGLANRQDNLNLLFGARGSVFAFPEPGSDLHAAWLNDQESPDPGRYPYSGRGWTVTALGMTAFLITLVATGHLPYAVLIAVFAAAVIMGWLFKRRMRTRVTRQVSGALRRGRLAKER